MIFWYFDVFCDIFGTLMSALWCFLTLWCFLMTLLAHTLMFFVTFFGICTLIYIAVTFVTNWNFFTKFVCIMFWYFSWCFNTLVAVNVSTEKYSLFEHHILRLLTCEFKWREHIRCVRNLHHNLKVTYTYDYTIFVNWHQTENTNPKNIWSNHKNLKRLILMMKPLKRIRPHTRDNPYNFFKVSKHMHSGTHKVEILTGIFIEFSQNPPVHSYWQTRWESLSEWRPRKAHI